MGANETTDFTDRICVICEICGFYYGVRSYLLTQDMAVKLSGCNT